MDVSIYNKKEKYVADYIADVKLAEAKVKKALKDRMTPTLTEAQAAIVS